MFSQAAPTSLFQNNYVLLKLFRNEP